MRSADPSNSQMRMIGGGGSCNPHYDWHTSFGFGLSASIGDYIVTPLCFSYKFSLLVMHSNLGVDSSSAPMAREGVGVPEETYTD